MPKIAFSDVKLRSLPLPEKGQTDYWDTTLASFGLRVSQGGAKTFVLNMHNRRHTIGRYPVISLSEARTEAKRLLAEKTLGKTRLEAITFKQALDLFLAEKEKSRRPNTVANHRQRMNAHFSFQGQLGDFTHQEFARRLRRIATTSEHDHALSVGKTFFTWAFNHRYINDNPTRGLSPHGHKSRARVLSDAELKLIWNASDRDELPEHFRTIVKLLILTGQRRTEIASLQKSFYSHNQQTLCLPGDLTKNHTEHTFPIGGTTCQLLNALLTDTSISLFFPARGKPNKCFNGWSKSKVVLDKLSGVTGWTLHDLRRTFRTNLSKLGVAPHISERLLNHISARSEVEATYDLYTFLPEMRKAMELWEAHLTSVLGITTATAKAA